MRTGAIAAGRAYKFNKLESVKGLLRFFARGLHLLQVALHLGNVSLRLDDGGDALANVLDLVAHAAQQLNLHGILFRGKLFAEKGNLRDQVIWVLQQLLELLLAHLHGLCTLLQIAHASRPCWIFCFDAPPHIQ